jgi:hypothetical protein
VLVLLCVVLVFTQWGCVFEAAVRVPPGAVSAAFCCCGAAAA